MIITITVVTIVSLRVGHVTFDVSERTCSMNSNGLVFAIPTLVLLKLLPAYQVIHSHQPPYWQEWRDSNPQPPVLETGALAN